MIQDQQYEDLMDALNSHNFKNNHLCEWRWCLVDGIRWEPVKIFCNSMRGMVGDKQVVVDKIGPRIPQIYECAELEHDRISNG